MEKTGFKTIILFKSVSSWAPYIRHSNNLYVGIYRDPDTGLPALLMELMDDSLTYILSGKSWHHHRSHFSTPMVSSTEISPATVCCWSVMWGPKWLQTLEWQGCLPNCNITVSKTWRLTEGNQSGLPPIVKVPVSEKAEQWQNYVSEVALSCLKSRDVECPSSQQLWRKIHSTVRVWECKKLSRAG